MYAEPLSTPSRANDTNGRALGGARWFFYASGTATLQAAYTAPALATAHANPVVADSNGVFPAVFFDPAKAYRAVLRAATGTTTIMDLDPVNPALFTQLKTAAGAGDVGFAQSGSGAVLRNVRDKLREGPIDVADFGAIGTADDTAVFMAAYAAAKLAKRPLRLPTGSFAVSGLAFDGNIPVLGAGPANTILRPTADGQTVVTLFDRNGGAATYIDRGKKVHVGDFAIDLAGRANCIGLLTDKLVSSAVERIEISAETTAPYARGNTGWRSVGDQYSAFRDIYIERMTRGFVMTSDAVAGGGINNFFEGLHVAYCQVNAMMFNGGAYPFGLNQFANLRLQNSGHCALYLCGAHGLAISMLSPEGDIASAATLTFEGHTIKAGTIHADLDSGARLIGYDHANNDTAMRIRAERHSSLHFDGSSGAAVSSEADATSTIEWEGTCGNGSVLRNTRLNLHASDSYRAIVAWQPAVSRSAEAFPNLVPSPMTVPLANIFGCTSTLTSDPECGSAREVTFAPIAGGLTTNAVWCTLAAQEFAVDDMVYLSVLLRSDRDTQIAFSAAQYTVGGTIDLVAGAWTRLFACNQNASGVTRYPALTLNPVAADAPVLRIARPVACKNLSAQQVRMLSAEHLFNPGDPAGEVLRQPAAPTTGSWALGTSVLTSAPAAGAAPGWTCVAAGAPGTWKAMSPLAA